MAQLATVHVFLDSNTALHFKRPDQIDWLELTGAAAVVLVVTPMFLRELEKLKVAHARPHMRRRADAFVKWLAGVARGGGSEIRTGVKLSFVVKEPVIDYVANDLDRAVADDALIASILAYDAAEGTRIRVATADLGLELKLRGRGLDPLELPEHLRLAEERDPVQQELEETRRRLAQHEARQPHLVLSFGDEERRSHLAVALRHPGEYRVPDSLEEVVRQNPPIAERKSNPGQPPGSTIKAGALRGLDLAELQGFLNPFMTPERIRAYNERLEQFIRQHAEYLPQHQAWVENDARTFEIALTLHNTGTAVATDIDIAIWFPEGIELLSTEDRPSMPQAPSPPARPGKLDLSGRPTLQVSRDMLIRTPYGITGSLDLDGEPLLDGATRSVRFPLRSLKHHHPYRLDPFLARFASREAIRSFEVEYRITTVELPRPTQGTLRFIVDQAPASSRPS